MKSASETPPYEEFSHCCTSQQWWIEVKVQMCNIILILHLSEGGVRRVGTWDGFLMNTHRVCERTGKEVVISDCELGEDVCERDAFSSSKVRKGGDVPFIWED